MIKLLEDKDGGGAEPSGEDAIIKGRSLETGEEVGVERSTERGSNDTEELVNVLTSLDAANILTSGVQAVSVPPAAEVSTVGIPTGSGMVPTASPIFTTASVVTPYSRRKGKEKMVETDTPKKKKLQEQIDVHMAREIEEQLAKEDQRMNEQIAKDAKIAKIHAEEELQMLIDGLDRNNETIAMYLQEYEQFAADLYIEEKIEMINELVKYQDHYAKVLKYQSQQRKHLSKKQQREFYMSVLKSHSGWKTKHFKGMSSEEIREKFIPIWKQIEDFVPMASKEEGERFKRKGLRLEQSSAKKMKTAEDVSKEDLKPMMQLVPVKEVVSLEKSNKNVFDHRILTSYQSKGSLSVARKRTPAFYSYLGRLIDGENLDKMKEKGDECIFVGYSTQSRAYRVYNKRTRVIMESIHVNFDELPQMASVQNSADPGPTRHSMTSAHNSSDPAPTCQTMASIQISSDPAPKCQTMVLKHASLSPERNCQANVSQGDKTGTTSNKLDLLFSPMFDELLNGSLKVVSKSSVVSAADAPNQHQQPSAPLNNHTTPVPSCQNPPITTTVISSESITQAEPHAENAQVADDEVFNKRTRVIMESIHVNFDELPQMASVQNSTDPALTRQAMASAHNSSNPAPTCQKKASVQISSDPALECQTMVLEHGSLSPGHNYQENVSHEDKTEPHAENDEVADDEFINIFSTPIQDQGETSSRHVDSSNMHTFYQRYPSEQRWTKDHPLEQVIGNPSQSVRTRRQLESDAKMCMFALTVSRTDPQNIKEAMDDSAWIESMQKELHQFDRLDVWKLEELHQFDRLEV
nr:hypothetical protein [Tanacetum cinerariifolium]